MIYAIGDIHGCHDQLRVLLAKIKVHAGHKPYRAIFLGDYVDRGPAGLVVSWHQSSKFMVRTL